MLRLLSIALLATLLSCAQDTSTDKNNSQLPQFSLIAPEDSGLDFENDLNDDPEGIRNVLSFQHYYNGGGVAVGDINNDGLPDVLMTANEGPNRLYLNKGNLRFEDITEKSGINTDRKNWSTGATMADVNGDGWLDIYICQAGYTLYPDRTKRENLLLINNGDGTFSEMAVQYGVNDDNESTSAAFFDYDQDGDLDLYVLNESVYAYMILEEVYNDLKDPVKMAQATGNLYRNDGDKFTKVTREAGVERYGFGLGLVVNDINGDGWTDIYVANDYSVPDFMFINNGDGTFTDEIKERTKQIAFFGMGADIADFNNDAHPDIAVVDMAANDHFRDKTLMASMDVEGFWYFIKDRGYQYQYMFNALQLNNGNGTFSNIAGLAGVLRTDWSWAVLFADFDHDELKDMYVTNGYRRYARDNDFRNEMAAIRAANNGSVPIEMRAEMYEKMPQIKDPNFMFKNNGDLSFSLVSEDWNLNHPSYSNGAAYADLDGDGDLDLIVNNIDDKAFLLKNNAIENNTGNYLKCSFQAESTAESPYNTKVYIHYDGKTQYQEFHPTRGYAGSMGQEVHFGLGQVETLDSLVVIWPGGKTQTIENLETNQSITLKKSDAKLGTGNQDMDESYAFTSLSADDTGLDFVHKENEFNDFAREILLPHKQSQQGPALATADVNGDGLEDIYVGGAMNQSGVLYIQSQDGRFAPAAEQPWEYHLGSEDLAAHFFDADGDGDMDLYVASGGGGEYPEGSSFLQDRIYINFGEKGFAIVNALPEMFTSSSTVTSADIDGDGYPELFVGGAAVPGKYPFASRSYILKFSANKYLDVTSEMAPGLEAPGMVKDAEFADVNGDGLLDLVVVGEWMGIKLFLNENGKLKDASEEWKTNELMGWWYSVAVEDVNGDGKADSLAGNLGRNTKFSASAKKPFNVFANDFDKNGTVDIVLSKEYNGKLVPARGRQCSSEQMPYIKNKFPTFTQFAKADLSDIYGEENLEEALHLQVNTFESAVLINEGTGFRKEVLPPLAQVAPINKVVVQDLNGDGKQDILIAGNMHEAEVETPRYDAGTGLVLLGDGTGVFEAMPAWKTGLYAAKNVKDFALIKHAGKLLLVVANNDDKLELFSFDGQMLQ